MLWWLPPHLVSSHSCSNSDASTQPLFHFRIPPVRVGASPIRLDIVNHPDDAPARIRFGYALGGNNPNIGSHHVTTVVRNDGSAFSTRPRGPCKGMKTRFRQKAAELSSAFRAALGLSPGASIAVSEHGSLHILPFPPPSFVALDPQVGAPAHHRPHHHHGHHRHGGHPLSEASFFHRLHIALMTLGPWEGRAFAFVLGVLFMSFVPDLQF